MAAGSLWADSAMIAGEAKAEAVIPPGAEQPCRYAGDCPGRPAPFVSADRALTPAASGLASQRLSMGRFVLRKTLHVTFSARNHTARIEPAAAVAQGHDLQRHGLDSFRISGVFHSRHQYGVC